MLNDNVKISISMKRDDLRWVLNQIVVNRKCNLDPVMIIPITSIDNSVDELLDAAGIEYKIQLNKVGYWELSPVNIPGSDLIKTLPVDYISERYNLFDSRIITYNNSIISSNLNKLYQIGCALHKYTTKNLSKE